MYLTIYASIGPLGFLAFIVWLGALLLDLLVRRRPSMPTWVLIGVGAGLLAEAGAAMTASTLMRYTTAASLWLLVGLILAVPSEGLRLPDRAELKHPRRWLGLRRAPAAPPDPGS
jgi:O-antigen ligase